MVVAQRDEERLSEISAHAVAFLEDGVLGSMNQPRLADLVVENIPKNQKER
jgi:hypothetical protein